MTRAIRHLPLATALLALAACDAPAPDAGGDPADHAPVIEVDHADEGAGHAGEAQTLRTIMQRLAVEMAGMQHALWLEDFDQVETRAAAIAEHPHMSQPEVARIRRELGPEMAAFEEADDAVHQASVRMHEAARTRETGAILDALAEVQRGCVACHERFRERLRAP